MTVRVDVEPVRIPQPDMHERPKSRDRIGLNPSGERRALQVAIALGGIVPVTAGLAGVLLGSAMLDEPMASVSLDSHVRYLSGLLLAIGLASWSLIPKIATAAQSFRLITFLVVVGGLARLGGVLAVGAPSAPMMFGLVMELIVTPALCVWQARVARRCQPSA